MPSSPLIDIFAIPSYTTGGLCIAMSIKTISLPPASNPAISVLVDKHISVVSTMNFKRSIMTVTLCNCQFVPLLNAHIHHVLLLHGGRPIAI